MKFFSMILFFVGGLVIAQPQQLPEDSVNAINRALILKFGLNLVDSTDHHTITITILSHR